MKSKKNKKLAAYFITMAMTATMVQAPITANAAVTNL